MLRNGGERHTVKERLFHTASRRRNATACVLEAHLTLLWHWCEEGKAQRRMEKRKSCHLLHKPFLGSTRNYLWPCCIYNMFGAATRDCSSAETESALEVKKLSRIEIHLIFNNNVGQVSLTSGRTAKCKAQTDQHQPGSKVGH